VGGVHLTASDNLLAGAPDRSDALGLVVDPTTVHQDEETQEVKVIGYDAGRRVKLTLVEVAPKKWLQPDAAAAFVQMSTAAYLDGITLHPNSCWRSFEDQDRLYKQWERGERKLRPTKPGYSRHHLGLAVDINRSHDDLDGSGPETGPTDKWLKAHAAKFGFYRTVPKELWHWEYVGVLESS
jgi:LAS superfamily LD-carboxypeptidase LdcB